MKKKDRHSDVCSHRHAFFLDNFIRKIFQNPKKIVGEYIRPGDTVFDIGCGPGYFAVEMAKMIGDKGHVYAIDLQSRMLDLTLKKAKKNRVTDRITCHRCSEDGLGLSEDLKADFVLAFYMVHETPDQIRFLKEMKTHLKSHGQCLIVEPMFHVGKKQFKRMEIDILELGFTIVDRPFKKGGRSLLISL